MEGTESGVLQRRRRKSSILTEGAPDRLASGGVQHGLFSGYVDFELHRFHLGPVELWTEGRGQDGRYMEPGAATWEESKQGSEDAGFL